MNAVSFFLQKYWKSLVIAAILSIGCFMLAQHYQIEAAKIEQQIETVSQTKTGAYKNKKTRNEKVYSLQKELQPVLDTVITYKILSVMVWVFYVLGIIVLHKKNVRNELEKERNAEITLIDTNEKMEEETIELTSFTDFIIRELSWDGRVDRTHFISANIFCFVVAIVIYSLHEWKILNTIITIIFASPLFLYALSIQIKRLHDMNRSGYWLPVLGCLSKVEIIGVLIFIGMCLIKGTEGKNDYDES